MVVYQSTDYKYHFAMSCLMGRLVDTQVALRERVEQLSSRTGETRKPTNRIIFSRRGRISFNGEIYWIPDKRFLGSPLRYEKYWIPDRKAREQQSRACYKSK